jgi:hypothetical protein
MANAQRAQKLAPGEKPGTSKVPFPVRPDGDAFKAEVHKQAGSIARKTHTAPVALVNLKDLETFQHTVNDERLVQHLDDPNMVQPGTRGSGHGGLVDKPIVIRKDGRMTIWDGNHRLTAAHLRGQETAKVRLIDLDGGQPVGQDRGA